MNKKKNINNVNNQKNRQPSLNRKLLASAVKIGDGPSSQTPSHGHKRWPAPVAYLQVPNCGWSTRKSWQLFSSTYHSRLDGWHDNIITRITAAGWPICSIFPSADSMCCSHSVRSLDRCLFMLSRPQNGCTSLRPCDCSRLLLHPFNAIQVTQAAWLFTSNFQP